MGEITKCGKGQIGPFQVWEKENSVSTYNREKNDYDRTWVCLDGTYRTIRKEGELLGFIETKHLKLFGKPLDANRWDYLWRNNPPFDTDPRFDLLLTAHSIEAHVSYLEGLKVFANGFGELLGKKGKPKIEVSTFDFANAGFDPFDFSMFFGLINNQCHFGADCDVIIHEFKHLLTSLSNPQLGLSFNDIEGLAMHETLSDIGAAIYHKDPQIGESIAVCVGAAKDRNPSIGMRTVDVRQYSLFYDEESHLRTELYSPVLWFIFERLAALFMRGGLNQPEAIGKARDVMTILTHNMAEFIPTPPKKSDFVKALYNALIDFSKQPHFGKEYGFALNAIELIIYEEARRRKLITNDDRKYAFTPYPYVRDIGEALKQITTAATRFRLDKSNSQGRQVFYQEYTGRYPVEGHGVRFIRTSNGIQMIDMRWKEDEPSMKPGMEPEEAWAKLRSPKVEAELKELLSPSVKHGLVSDQEKFFILFTIGKLREGPMPTYDLVYISGSKNLQYKFRAKEITIYIDSKSGKLNISRKRFY